MASQPSEPNAERDLEGLPEQISTESATELPTEPAAEPTAVSATGAADPAPETDGLVEPRPWPRRHPVLTGLLAVLGLAGTCLLWQLATWPDVARLATENPETTAFIERYRARQRAAGEPDRVSWRWVPYAQISPHLKRAVLVSEDINFFSHDGFDTAEMEKALTKAWEQREFPRGASTLTQQLAKNLWLSPSKNPLRKLEEALLTRQLERHLTKRRILELYLNVAEMGPGVYGAEAAARHWFGVPALDLTERQAAQLAASLPRPRSWHPGVASRGYARRVESVLRRMDKARWLWNEI